MKLSFIRRSCIWTWFLLFGYRVMKFSPSRYPSKCWNVNRMPCSVNNESCFYPDSQQTDMACWRTGFTFQYRTAFALHTGNTRNRAAHENKAHLSCALFIVVFYKGKADPQLCWLPSHLCFRVGGIILSLLDMPEHRYAQVSTPATFSGPLSKVNGFSVHFYGCSDPSSAEGFCHCCLLQPQLSLMHDHISLKV